MEIFLIWRHSIGRNILKKKYICYVYKMNDSGTVIKIDVFV